MERRQTDPRIAALLTDVTLLKAEMEANTKITLQVRDILSSFHMVGRIAKWVTSVVTAIVVVFSVIKGVKA
jgi:hypothetical protein